MFLNRRLRLHLLASLLLLLACSPRPDTCAVLQDARDQPTTGERNLLLVIADDLGTDQLETYVDSPDLASTPTLDCLADQGVVFRNAWAAPMCSPARAAILTGQHAHRHGLGTYINVQSDDTEVDVSSPSLPRILQRGGYDTALAGKWHLSSALSEHHYTHPRVMGFDHHAGSLGNLGGSSWSDGALGYDRWEKIDDGAVSFTEVYPTTDTVDEAARFATTLSAPWFLQVAFNAPHAPWHVPPRRLSHRRVDEDSSAQEKYRAAVEALDTELGRLIDELGPEVMASTTVVFLSDNGTPREAIDQPFGPRRAKGTLYEGGVHVPLIVAGAGVADPGREVAGLVHAVDLLPTAVSLAGQPPVLGIDGMSFAGVLEDSAAATHRTTLYADRFTPNGDEVAIEYRAIRDADYKLIRRTAHDELYVLDGQLDEGEDLLSRPLDEEAERAYEWLDARLGEVRSP